MSIAQRVNWVVCPNCRWRFYVGAQLLVVEGVKACCPKCSIEFDARTNLEQSRTEVSAADRF